MKAILLITAALALFLFGCSSKEEKESLSIASFYKSLNVWLKEGTPKAAKAVCRSVATREINQSKEYAKVITDGDVCQASLEENFSFLLGEDRYQLLSIKPFSKAGEEKKEKSVIEVQPVRVFINTPNGEEVVASKAAALIENNKINNLAGMRLSTLAPREFALSLGTNSAIPIDPVSAAYYSAKDKK